MSLEERVKEHLKSAGDQITERQSDLTRVVSRGRRRKAGRIISTGVLIGAVLVGAALLWPVREEPPVVTSPPSPTTTAPVVSTSAPVPTPTSVPGSAVQGHLETWLGTFSWRHLTGDESTLPYPDTEGMEATSSDFLPYPDVGGLVATSSGYLMIGENMSFWRSPDGYQWAQEPLPVSASASRARLVELQDEVWLSTFTPDGLWRSPDGVTWTAVPVPEGVSLEQASLDEAADGIWLIGPKLWRLDGSQWAEIDDDPPWPLQDASHAALFTDADDGFVVYDLQDGSRSLYWWSSPDATNWSSGRSVNIALHRFESFTERDGVVIGETAYDEGRIHVYAPNQEGEWYDVLAPGDVNFRPLILFDRGGVYINYSAETMWVSEDLIDWVPDVDPNFELDFGFDITEASIKGGEGMVGYGAGNKIFFVQEDDQSGERDMWVWELQE